MINFVLEKIVKIIEGISILIAIWAVILTIINFLKKEFIIKKHKLKIEENTILKNDLASYVLLSFEILIAADVILSIIRPTFRDLGILASLVIIRTFISYFLNKELKYFKKNETDT
ncbi:MAG: DUF1622 domain-containing protein [Sarcina sp.]